MSKSSRHPSRADAGPHPRPIAPPAAPPESPAGPSRAQRRRGGASLVAESADPEPTVGVGRAALVFAAVALLYFLPAFLPGRQLFGTDYLAGGYPILEQISARLADGALPGWLPGIFGGVPLHANPGSTYHPVRLLADLLLPLPRVMPAVLVVHLALAGLGTYLLLRELGARGWVALVAGLAYELTGILLSGVYAGHDGRIIVAALAPLFLFCLSRAVRTGRIAAYAGAAATLGGALLSFQLQSCYYLLLAGAAWVAFLLVHHGLLGRPGALARRAGLALLAVALGFGIAAVDLLPFADAMAESARGAGGAGRGYAFATSYSMPPAELTGVAAPEQAGVLADYRGANPFKFHTEYVGAAVLVLLALGVAFARGDRRWRFFLGLALVAVTMAFGGHTPLYRLYYAVLPGVDRLRAPAIAFYLVSLSLVVMAGLTLERLAALRAERRAGAAPHRRPAARAVGAVVGLALLGALVGSLEARGAAAAAGWLRFALTAAVVGGALWLWLDGGLRTRTAAVALAVLTALDLAVVARPFFRTEDPPEQLFAADDVVDFLKAQGTRDRVWVLPFAAGQPPRQVMLGAGRFGPRTNYLLHHGIETAGGEHGNQLRRWDEYVGTDSATGAVDWHQFVDWTTFMEAANVGWIVSGTTLNLTSAADGTPLAGIRLAHDGPVKIYRNDRVLPRAYLVPGARAVAGPDAALAAMRTPTWDPRLVAIVEGPASAALPASGGTPLDGGAELVSRSADRVVVRTRASRPALLVLADNFARGWTARVDGEPAPLLRTNYTFRGVPVGAGAHEVVFAYRPAGVHRGLALSAASALLVAAVGLAGALAGRRRDGAASPELPAARVAAPSVAAR